MTGEANGVGKPCDRLRVLVVDDHAPMREDVTRTLGGDPRFEICAEAADAAGAVAEALRTRPDICLLDIRMPGGGLAAAWEIRARIPEAKIVMLTVSDEEADLFEALRCGATGYLLKGMNPDRLPEALYDIHGGTAAIPRPLVTKMVQAFTTGEPRWRAVASPVGRGERLTTREWEVLELLARECSTDEIATRLMLSQSGVRVHVAAILRKLGVHDRREAVALFRGDSAS